MAELIPISFANLLKRIFHEYGKNNSIFDLPARKIYRPGNAVDMSVEFCGNRAANPVGPAAGPQTQLAQNIVLSWLAGSRILELKTVQINDRLQLNRPCIDTATIGYNTEWSQELSLDESLREYVKGSMIIEILKHWLMTDQSNLDTIFDVSVGYDLKGIQSRQIRSWLHSMRNASLLIEELRCEIPSEFSAYRDLPFKPEIANSLTLSTFHGTPAGEIERISEFLLTELDYHVIIKMNPPMLGRERLEHLLHEKLGYTDIAVNENIYNVNITFQDAVGVVRRLQSVANGKGKTVGVKFGNTLEVLNNGTFLKDNVQFLAGQPLHVIHLALVEEWRKIFGPRFPISFAAGVDANNFADCVSIGLVPITTCTDLLRPGGYGRLPQYLVNLEHRMKLAGAATIGEFIMRSSPTGNDKTLDEAIISNTHDVVLRSVENPRYHAVNNQKRPKKIGSHLELWDCINCDKCIPVCPNDANFYFEIEPLEIQYKNVLIKGGEWSEIRGGVFKIEESHQIATFADACNDCGNCDVFCPEDGGPYIEKPRFFGSLNAWEKWKTLTGFVLVREQEELVLRGRFKDRTCTLKLSMDGNRAEFLVTGTMIAVEWSSQKVVGATSDDPSSEQSVDMAYYWTMATLMKGMIDNHRVHFVNVGVL
jgi:putative selenate reductase